MVHFRDDFNSVITNNVIKYSLRVFFLTNESVF